MERYTIIEDHDAAYYYQNGVPHRVGGPAVVYANGQREWWCRGQRHRVGGPAVIFPDGTQEWWVEGVQQMAPPPTTTQEHVYYIAQQLIPLGYTLQLTNQGYKVQSL